MRPSARWWRPALLLAGTAVAVAGLRAHLPSATWLAVRAAAPWWLAAAAALSVLSMAAFSEQQRRLLAAFGVPMPAGASLALTYARSAMAAALPAGSAISAGYAFRRFRDRGAGHAAAGAVVLLSGVASLAGLAVLYGVIEAPWLLWVLAGGAAVLALRPRAAGAAGPSGGRLRDTLRLARTVPPGRWVAVVGIAVANWGTDLGCLLAAVQAVHLDVAWTAVATGYLVAQLARQVPVTPGGAGVIEAALVIALTAAGAATAPAAAAVLVYRVLSCWGVLPIGLACWAAARRSAPVPTRPWRWTPA
ncbi:YbhN family protein [Dactylosporangium sp. NPDC051485]|uniref:lysylphosphatidylglycerol synthase transmembrane domain-containing protein n=1 Tax=Dactylosporangium sp. NPDC051485 TaxID=3154846 RepID=UPI003418AC80